MGIGLDLALITGKSSLIAREAEMAVIANNLSNVNNKDYHRQKAILETGLELKTGYGFFGTGVNVSNVTREYDSALELSYRNSLSDYHYNDTYHTALEGVQDSVAPGGESELENAVQEFADAWQGVASNPESLGDRQTLIFKAENVKENFNQQYESLKRIYDDYADTDGLVTGDVPPGAIKDTVTELNTHIQTLVEYNLQVYKLEDYDATQEANLLRDQRDATIKGLSKLIPATVTEQTNGAFRVVIGGVTVINGSDPEDESRNTTYLQMAVKVDTTTTVGNYGRSDIAFTWDDTSTTAVTFTDGSGKLKGYQDAYDYVGLRMDELWEFGENIAYIVNTQQQNGFDLDGGTPVYYETDANIGWISTATVENIFGFTSTATGGTTDPYITPGQMTVAITSASKVAACYKDYSGTDSPPTYPSVTVDTGNGDNAMNVWESLNTLVSALASGTAPDSEGMGPFSGIVIWDADTSAVSYTRSIPRSTMQSNTMLNRADYTADAVASNVSLYEDITDNSKNSKIMFEEKIQDRSGVLMDEELSNMLAVQKAYQAAARFMTVVDNMLDAIINMA